MSNITTLLNNSASTEAVAPTHNTLLSSLKEMKGLVANSINTTVGIANETLSIANDIVSSVPIIIQGSKETIKLTGLFTRAVAMNSVLTEEQIAMYDALTPSQRKHFRSTLIQRGGAGFVAALSELFAEEDASHKSTDTTIA